MLDNFWGFARFTDLTYKMNFKRTEAESATEIRRRFLLVKINRISRSKRGICHHAVYGGSFKGI